MNSKLIMVASSCFLCILGISATFLPHELLNKAGIVPTKEILMLIQIMGALYFGFGIMNWMAKTVLIGGIYARPLAVGNFAHFMIAAIALIKSLSENVTIYMGILTIAYTIFAILFGWVLFTNPSMKKNT